MWSHSIVVEEGGGGGMLVLELRLVEDDDFHRGYNYHVQEDVRGTWHMVRCGVVFNITVTEKGGATNHCVISQRCPNQGCH